MRLLADRPSIGHLRIDLADEALRFWPVFSYLIVYRLDTEPLQIIRGLHGARDVRRYWEADRPQDPLGVRPRYHLVSSRN